ncbi:MAG: leucyl aminopeptidase [Alphaproteobacteria bacterium]|nr:leucyl aminopeptidase [Alphaproteobacteria bacterium]
MDILFKQSDYTTENKLIIGVYENLVLSNTAKKIDDISKGTLLEALNEGQFNGKLGEYQDFTFLKGCPVSHIICLGLGKVENINDLTCEKIGAYAVQAVSSLKVSSISFAADDLSEAHIGFGAKLASYRFNKYQTLSPNVVDIKEFHILTDNAQSAQNKYEPFYALAKGIHTTRELMNEPSNVMYPETVAKRAEELTKYGLTVEVYDEKALKAKGLNLMLGVAKGSCNPPNLIVVQWNGLPESKETHATLVGKGVCFDSGGLSLKPSAGMEDMKEDLAGAATVLGVLQTLAIRKAKVNVVGIMAMVENMPSSKAQRPGDIVKSLSGKTVEVVNTDAEGRLVLGDALWYAQERFNSPVIIDMATLTGAILVCLGSTYAGLFTNDENLSEKLKLASKKSGDKIWEMPMDQDFDDMIKSDVADIKNCTNTRNAGSCTAAAFLKHFIKPGVAWAHLDTAGVAFLQKPTLFSQKGGSGFGVALLNQYILDNLEQK